MVHEHLGRDPYASLSSVVGGGSAPSDPYLHCNHRQAALPEVSENRQARTDTTSSAPGTLGHELLEASPEIGRGHGESQRDAADTMVGLANTNGRGHVGQVPPCSLPPIRRFRRKLRTGTSLPKVSFESRPGATLETFSARAEGAGKNTTARWRNTGNYPGKYGRVAATVLAERSCCGPWSGFADRGNLDERSGSASIRRCPSELRLLAFRRAVAGWPPRESRRSRSRLRSAPRRASKRPTPASSRRRASWRRSWSFSSA